MTLDELVRQIVREEITAYMAQLGPGPTQVAQPPVAAPPVQVPGNPMTQPPPAGMPGPGNLLGPSSPPAAVPPGPPVASPPGSPAAGAPPVTAPTPPTAPVAGVPSLDDLRALANDLMRTKPEKATEFQAFMASKGVASLGDMKPADYLETANKFKSLMGMA